ncbi:uncharacterized protein [Medicago truncatula]|uniref:uncharacterized protein n=1 Tax=Medicago truncatula TaxID=3880 RepID=UPI0019671913|nr:uncharacterized protein LOC120579529 [Medicago truncatula]
MQEVDEDDPMIYPTHLDKLLGLELALRVKYQAYYHQSSVQGFSSDAAVIERIKRHLRPDGMQSDVQEVDETVVNNDPTQLFELRSTSSSVECSKVIPTHVNIVGNNPTQSVKVEQKTSSGKGLKSVPVSMG